MKTRSVYEFKAYKSYASHRFTGVGQRGQLSRAAERMGCQPSFLSRALSSEIQLTPDHAFALTQFWTLPADEAEYFQLLVERDRAATSDYRRALDLKLDGLRTTHESLQKRTRKEDFASVSHEALYFSSWHFSAIHFLTSIPRYQRLNHLAARFGFSEAMTRQILEQLREMGMVRRDGANWVYAGGQFHLPKHSPYSNYHHQNWRNRAVLDAQILHSESVHYTSVLTLSKSDAARLKQRVLEFISETIEIAGPSEPEESMVFNCDWFLA